MLNINSENYNAENILSKENLLKEINELRNQGKKIGYCNGSFDLLHPGHITYLISAKKICDILVVGIAHDNYSSSKRSAKGRPIFSHNLRAFMISKLIPVDFVFIDETPTENITLLKPDIYIKGIDYIDETHPEIIIQKKIIESYGGKIHYTKTEKLSTSEIIKHIKQKIG